MIRDIRDSFVNDQSDVRKLVAHTVRRYELFWFFMANTVRRYEYM